MEWWLVLWTLGGKERRRFDNPGGLQDAALQWIAQRLPLGDVEEGPRTATRLLALLALVAGWVVTFLGPLFVARGLGWGLGVGLAIAICLTVVLFRWIAVQAARSA